jgi:hypothetical protein
MTLTTTTTLRLPSSAHSRAAGQNREVAWPVKKKSTTTTKNTMTTWSIHVQMFAVHAHHAE